MKDSAHIEVNNIHIKCCLLQEVHPFGVRRFCPPPVLLIVIKILDQLNPVGLTVAMTGGANPVKLKTKSQWRESCQSME